jgi:gliding motility-associated-like protein
LVVAYRGNACARELTKPINIVAAPTASITTPTNIFSTCSGVELPLAVSSDFTTYQWSTSETTPAISVTAAGTYTVELTNAIGCKITASKVVTALPSPIVSVAATPGQINIGETTQLEATEGMESYEWTPSETLSNATVADPVATPEESTTYTVVVTNTSGCEGTADVEIIVTQDDITNILKPSNFFTPNDIDTINPVWEVGNILSFPQCGVVIFDDKGQKVYEAKPYLNEWDGTRDGKQVPAGVYYYIIRCDGESQTKGGSITLIR